MRHGIAVDRGEPGFAEDAARPLTGKGRRQLRQIAPGLRRLAGRLDWILSSPLVRARQTAEIIAAELNLEKRLEFSNALAPGGAPALLLRQLGRAKSAPDKLLLVGHEPDLSRFVSLLLTGGPDLQLELKKGGICKLEAQTLRADRCATLAWLLTPKQLKRLA